MNRPSTIDDARSRRLLLASLLADPAAPPCVMGILNVTPDSFSDGGRFFSTDAAVERALEMIQEGADLIDIGPESTRPGSEPVPENEQIARAVPVIEILRRANSTIPISIDTRLASVAVKAIEAGANMVNDVSALRDDPAMAGVVADSGVSVVLMHRFGDSKSMQAGGGPHYENVVQEIRAFFQERMAFAEGKGIHRSQILLDPGLGFGKRIEHNFLILKHLGEFFSLGRPLVIGASRKSFIGTITGTEDPSQRQAGSLACAVIAAMTALRCSGQCLILRVHDVAETVQAMRVCTAVSQSSG